MRGIPHTADARLQGSSWHAIPQGTHRSPPAVARPIIKRIASVCIAIDQKATIATGLLAQLLRISYLRNNPWEIQPWQGLIALNSPGHTRIHAPVLITQGERPGV